MTKKKIGSAQIKNGVATIQYNIPSNSEIGNKIIYAVYHNQQDGYILAETYNTITIKKQTNIIIDDIEATPQEKIILKARVMDNNNNPVISGYVRFKIGNQEIKQDISVKNGLALFEYTTQPYEINTTIQAKYFENDTYISSISTIHDYRISKKNVIINVHDIYANRGETIDLTAEVTDETKKKVNKGIVEFEKEE